MDYNELLTCALDIGELMLISGAEIGRVEDSVKRIVSAYDIARADIFTITSNIVVTLTPGSGVPITQTRRILRYDTDLEKLHSLNNLSRYICREKPNAEYIAAEVARIRKMAPHKLLTQVAASALIAGSFTVFFGGKFTDGLISALIGAIVKLLVHAIDKTQVNAVFSNLICSAVASLIAFLFVHFGAGQDVSKIIIGNIMLLIPGIALTNSMRDLINGDIIAGCLRLCEAIVIALAIAGGFILVSLLFGGAAA